MYGKFTLEFASGPTKGDGVAHSVGLAEAGNVK